MTKKHKEIFQKIIMLLTIYVLMAGLIAWRVGKMLSYLFSGFSFRLYISVYTLLCLLMPTGYLLPQSVLSKGFQMIGNYWCSLQFVLLFSILAEWPAEFIVIHLLRFPWEKRMKYFSLSAFGAGFITFIYGAVHEQRIKVREYICTVNKKNLKSGELRIVHLSDLHLSSINDLRKIQQIVSTVNSLSADYVCITGDTFTDNTREVFKMDAIAAEFRKINSTSGVYTCLGNHDAGPDLSKMKSFFQDAGIALLEDAVIHQDNVLLIGRTDMTSGGNMRCQRPSIGSFLKDISTDNLIVAMDHQPGDIDNCSVAGVDILLSGHTHGGQFFPLNLIIRRFFPHYRGCKQIRQMYSIVSPGTCTPVPYIRAIGDSEIILVRVQNQPEQISAPSSAF